MELRPPTKDEILRCKQILADANKRDSSYYLNTDWLPQPSEYLYDRRNSVTGNDKEQLEQARQNYIDTNIVNNETSTIKMWEDLNDFINKRMTHIEGTPHEMDQKIYDAVREKIKKLKTPPHGLRLLLDTGGRSKPSSKKRPTARRRRRSSKRAGRKARTTRRKY